MTKKVIMDIVTPARKVLSVEADSVIIPAENGYIGILPSHAPLVTSLGIGLITYKNDGKEDKLALCGGFMEVRDNKITIMADSAECSMEIDIERAKRAEEKARELLRTKKESTDLLRAEMALRRALIRQQAAGRD